MVPKRDPNHVDPIVTNISIKTVSENPPKSYSYSKLETPIFIERLKSEFPDAAIQAVEATSLDRKAMRLWWKARIATLKAAQEFAEFARHQRGDEALH
jgi:hypothetical protein